MTDTVRLGTNLICEYAFDDAREHGSQGAVLGKEKQGLGAAGQGGKALAKQSRALAQQSRP